MQVGTMELHRGVKINQLTLLVKCGDRWQCRCDCGRQQWVQTGCLLRGRTKSCTRCRFDRQIIHGHTYANSRTYRIWNQMRRRCHPTNGHPDYSGRGIRVVPRWNSFTNFLADMKECPPGLTLGRIDNNGDYGPTNCRWETHKQQARNRRGSRYLTAFGETKTIADWLEDPRCRPPKWALYDRIADGWDHTEALTLGPRERRTAQAAVNSDNTQMKMEW